VAAAGPTPDSPATPTPSAPQAPVTPLPAPPDPLTEPPPLGVPTPPASAPSMSPLSMSPMSVISDGEQDRRDEALHRLRRERLAVEYGLLRTDGVGNQVLSDRSDGQETEFGVRRRRGPRSPHASAVDSGTTERDTSLDGDERGAASDDDFDTVCSSQWYSPTIVGGSPSDGSLISSSYSSHMLHAGARRRRRGVLSSSAN